MKMDEMLDRKENEALETAAAALAAAWLAVPANKDDTDDIVVGNCTSLMMRWACRNIKKEDADDKELNAKNHKLIGDLVRSSVYCTFSDAAFRGVIVPKKEFLEIAGAGINSGKTNNVQFFQVSGIDELEALLGSKSDKPDS